MSDIAGFTELMGANEPQTMALLRADMDVLSDHITRQGGEIIKVVGDGLLALFKSAPKAVRACIDAQEELSDSPLKHRIAIHAGEVTVAGGDAYGDAVNVCARIEAITKPGTVSTSKIVVELIRSQDIPEPFRNGKLQLKGIEGPVEIFSWGNTNSFQKRNQLKLASGVVVALVVICGGFFANANWRIINHSDESRPSPVVPNPPHIDQNSPVAMTAEEALDQAYDEVWQEKEDFDRVREEAIKAMNPQLVIDWLNSSPLGQRDRGRLELEHWSLVKQALIRGKELAGKDSDSKEILNALKNVKDPGMAIAAKAFADEFQLVK